MTAHTNPNLINELDGALDELETSLAGASSSLVVVRRSVGQLSALVDVVRELEETMNRVRASLGALPSMAGQQPPLRAVPPSEPPQASFAPAETPETPYPPAEPQPETGFEMSAEILQDETATPKDEGVSQQPSNCLRLGVAAKTGSLDLKAVDGSVNENPSVVDVALLDYDGRRATLKLWINEAADPFGVRDALLGSLRRHLGGENDADVEIEFEGAA